MRTLTRRLPLLAALFLLLPGAAAAQQVYKCKGKSGETVYAEHPCDARAEPMKLRDNPAATGTSSPPPATTNDAGEPASTPASSANASELEANRSAERSCIANATASIYGSSNDRVGTLQQQMAVLKDELSRAEDAQRSHALRTRMETFRQAISREYASAHTQLNTARRGCINQHRPTPAPAR